MSTRYLRGISRAVVLTVGLSFTSISLSAADWYDDFDDGSITDGNPVTWTFNEIGVTPGIYDASSGDLRMSAPGGPTGNDDNLVASVDMSFTNTYVRTQAVVDRGPNPEGGGNLGIAVRYDPFTFSGYSALIDHNGQYNIVNVLAGSILPLVTGELPELAARSDVMLEFQAIGSRLNFFAWRPDEPRPSIPIAFFDDPDFVAGRAGVSYNEDEDNTTGIFRFAAAQDSPFDIPCDFNGDLVCDVTDIDLLTLEASSGGTRPIFDLTNDGSVNIDDVDSWRSQAGARNLGSGRIYRVGDANLDGGVDGSDFGAWNASKFTATGRWSEGDFNVDGASDGTDFGLWNVNKFSSADAAAVPEPSSLSATLLGLGLFCLASRFSVGRLRHRRHQPR